MSQDDAPPPPVLPFSEPPRPTTRLSGSLDLATSLGLLPSYDTFIRPYFRNPRPLASTADSAKGKEPDDGTTAAADMRRANRPMDLKRMKGDFEDLVEECVVLDNDHPSVAMPPNSLQRVLFEAPGDDWASHVVDPGREELAKAGWSLSVGKLPEAEDISLFVRIEKPVTEKRKSKKKKRVTNPGDPVVAGAAHSPFPQSPAAPSPFPLDVKRARLDTMAAASPKTPRTPGLGAGTPGGSARTPRLTR